MHRRFFFCCLILLLAVGAAAQNQLEITVLEAGTEIPLVGATVQVRSTELGALTDESGRAVLSRVPEGPQVVDVTFIGYEPIKLEMDLPASGTLPVLVRMSLSEEMEEEVVIEATRANRTVTNLPTRTEVLTEEIDEAASMEPSRIAHLITHSTGIQVQTTAASSSGAVARIQGLYGRYTQLLKDGFPLYGGFSGSLDVLQIPPLDLRQVEYVKGPASTLYGGGAIGGLINLLTKKPVEDETLLHLNLSHIGARDFNAFVARRFGRFGFTNLASFHQHRPYDADGDGYSDVPEVSKINFNPKLFYYPDDRTEIYLGANIGQESRVGGEMALIADELPDATTFFLDEQKSRRITSQFSARRELSAGQTLTLKNSVSLFDRFISVQQSNQGRPARFGGQQLNSFSEVNYGLVRSVHNLNVGLNLYTERFEERPADFLRLRDQMQLRAGVYLNHLWDVSRKFSLESGLRTDWAQAEGVASKSEGETFVLPRISGLYKVHPNFSIRMGGGMGYRMPTLFNEEAEPFAYQDIQPLDFANLEAERSYGGNLDLKYQSTFGSDQVLLTLNQVFFYNLIDNPILLTAQPPGILVYDNVGDAVISQGFESQVKLTVWKFTWFLGYTYTDAFLAEGASESELPLTPRHSVKGDLLFVEDGKWRIGWDYEYKSGQMLSNGLRTRSLFTTGIVVERTIDNFVVFLNAENFTDVRQTRYETLVSAPFGTPQFTEIWAPLDGFFFNAGLKIRL